MVGQGQQEDGRDGETHLYVDCQGHSHPKLSVVQGVGSRSSADKIQPTAHKPTGYGQYSGVDPRPLNNEGRCCVKPSSV